MTNKQEALNRTAGRFTTLVVNRSGRVTSYCARIQSTTSQMVMFEDVNTGEDRRALLRNVQTVRSGSVSFNS
jgi:hypothetical protein